TGATPTPTAMRRADRRRQCRLRRPARGVVQSEPATAEAHRPPGPPGRRRESNPLDGSPISYQAHDLRTFYCFYYNRFVPRPCTGRGVFLDKEHANTYNDTDSSRKSRYVE